MLQFAESSMYYVTFYMALRTQGQFEFETSAFKLHSFIAFFHLRGRFNYDIFLRRLFPDFVPDSCKRQLGADKCCRKFDRPFRKQENNFVGNPRDILTLKDVFKQYLKVIQCTI